VASGEGIAIVLTLALGGIVQDGVDVVDVPGLGTRRIVLRRFDPRRSTRTPIDTVARLLPESAASFDTINLLTASRCPDVCRQEP
jgi:hypothetical protein